MSRLAMSRLLRDLYGMEPKVLSAVEVDAIALTPIKAAAGRVRTKLLAEFRTLAASQVNLKLTAVLCRCRLHHPLQMMKEDTIEIVGFHAHIYFDTDSRDAAARVREGLSRFEVQLGRWHDKPIGPHPQAMYQVAFLPPQFGKVVPWLMLHREELDILVHPETGDDVADHTTHSLWLGEKLELNVEFLRSGFSL